MKKKICSHPSCRELIDDPGPSRCKKHEVKPFQNALRSNQTLYNTIEWRRLRKRIIERDGQICTICGEWGNDVHHKIPPRNNKELFFDESNCITICKSCHRIITAEEIRNRPLGR